MAFLRALYFSFRSLSAARISGVLSLLSKRSHKEKEREKL